MGLQANTFGGGKGGKSGKAVYNNYRIDGRVSGEGGLIYERREGDKIVRTHVANEEDGQSLVGKIHKAIVFRDIGPGPNFDPLLKLKLILQDPNNPKDAEGREVFDSIDLRVLTGAWKSGRISESDVALIRKAHEEAKKKFFTDLQAWEKDPNKSEESRPLPPLLWDDRTSVDLVDSPNFAMRFLGRLAAAKPGELIAIRTYLAKAGSELYPGSTEKRKRDSLEVLVEQGGQSLKPVFPQVPMIDKDGQYVQENGEYKMLDANENAVRAELVKAGRTMEIVDALVSHLTSLYGEASSEQLAEAEDINVEETVAAAQTQAQAANRPRATA